MPVGIPMDSRGSTQIYNSTLQDPKTLTRGETLNHVGEPKSPTEGGRTIYNSKLPGPTALTRGEAFNHVGRGNMAHYDLRRGET